MVGHSRLRIDLRVSTPKIREFAIIHQGKINQMARFAAAKQLNPVLFLYSLRY